MKTKCIFFTVPKHCLKQHYMRRQNNGIVQKLSVQKDFLILLCCFLCFCIYSVIFFQRNKRIHYRYLGHYFFLISKYFFHTFHILFHQCIKWINIKYFIGIRMGLYKLKAEIHGCVTFTTSCWCFQIINCFIPIFFQYLFCIQKHFCPQQINILYLIPFFS